MIVGPTISSSSSSSSAASWCSAPQCCSRQVIAMTVLGTIGMLVVLSQLIPAASLFESEPVYVYDFEVHMPRDTRYIADDTHSLQWMLEWPSIFGQLSHAPKNISYALDLYTGDPHALDNRLWTWCSRNDSIASYRIGFDSLCSTLWMQRAQVLPISTISEALDVVGPVGTTVHDRQEVAIYGFAPEFDDTCRQYQGSSSEAQKALLATTIDRILGFQRVPPTVYRSNLHISKSLDVECELFSRPSGVASVLVSRPRAMLVQPDWFTHAGDFSRLSDEVAANINFYFTGFAFDIQTGHLLEQALELMTANLWMFLTGSTGSGTTLRDHGIEALGDQLRLVYVRHPLMQFERPAVGSDKLLRNLRDLCHFPMHIARRILMLSPRGAGERHPCGHSRVEQFKSLGDLVLESLQQALNITTSPTWFSQAHRQQLDHNVAALGSVIRECMLHFTESKVLVDDPNVKRTTVFEAVLAH